MKKKLLQTCLFLTLLGMLSVTAISNVSATKEWTLRVDNTNTSVNYNYDQLLAMPETNVSAFLSCYGAPITSGDWSGVSLNYLLEQTGLPPTTSAVNFLAQDGYKVSLPLQVANESNVIIAYQLNGVYLPETLRLVLPGYNGNMWISMITSITMSTSTPQPTPATGIGPTMPNIPIWQSSTPAPTQTPNTSPKNQTNTEPTATPTNITQPTQPTQKAPVQQESNPKNISLPVEVVYGVAFGATIALLATAIAFIRRRNIRELSSPIL